MVYENNHTKTAHPKSSWYCLFKQARYGREQQIFHWPASKSHASWPQQRANGLTGRVDLAAAR